MDACFDLLVIGAGSGGLAAAKRAASYSARVAIVEGDRVGGTCVIRGCVPKKLLVYGSAFGHLAEDARAYGWQLSAPVPQGGVLLQRVRDEVLRLEGIHRQSLIKSGVTLVEGWASLRGPHSVEVNASGQPARTLQADRLLIAAGGRPQRPSIPGVELAWVSDDLFLLEVLPQRVVIVGAGFIACEVAGILLGLGVQVCQLVRGNQLLKGFDREAVAVVQEGLLANGLELRFQQAPIAIEGEPGALTLRTQSGESFACGGVLLATGRRPLLQGLDLEAAGVAVTDGRIVVDGDQATSVPHIYAVGDVTDRVNLTPVAIDEGRAFADTIYGGKPRRVNHDLVPKAVFSQPELASVGLSEEEAIERFGTNFIEVHRARFRAMAQALPQRGPLTLLKLVVHRPDQRVLGCHMVGEHSAEIIQMAAIALGMGATKADFDRTMALHPTVAEEFVTMA
jgi:glutathione reductase (NADPH)